MAERPGDASARPRRGAYRGARLLASGTAALGRCGRHLARVDLWGAQRKIVYLDVSETQLAELGLTKENIAATLQLQNAVVDAGGVDLLNRRLRIAPTGTFASPEDIGDLTIRSNPLERAQALALTGRSESANELIRIRDIGTVRPGYADPPT